MTASHKSHWLGLCIAGCLAILAASAHAAEIDLPDGVADLVEAEADKPKSTSEIVEDDAASGGKAVASDKTWEPILETDAYADLAGRVTVWVRYKGGPVQLKTIDDGKQTDRDWSWAKPDGFAWHKIGTYDASQLGERVRIIRGEFDGTTVVDCIAVDVEETGIDTPQDAGDVGITGEAAGGGDALPPAFPDEAKPIVVVPLSIDWQTVTHTMPQDMWGVSLFKIVKPDQSNSPGYAEWLTRLSPSLVRVHSAEMTEQWWDAEAEDWNVEAIERCFAPHRDWLASGDVKLMMCMPYDIPAALRGEPENGKHLDPEHYDAALASHRQLISVLTDDLGVPVTHWELTNEWDNTYEKLGKLDELWAFLDLLAEETRSASPGTQVGGPALTWPKPVWIDGLIETVADDLDFVSWHGYAIGKPTTPNDAVMERAVAIADHAGEVHAELDEAGFGEAESYLTEFNVQWTWRPYERRHANSVGAAFLAKTVAEMARQGVTGATVWHAMGDAYGLVDGDARMRATGQLYLWANRYAHGDVAAFGFSDDFTPPTTRPADDEANPGLVVVPIVRADGRRTLMLANTTDGTIRVDAATGDLLGVSDLRHLAITATGGTVAELTSDMILELPGFSVHFVTDAASTESLGEVDLSAQHAKFGF